MKVSRQNIIRVIAVFNGFLLVWFLVNFDVSSVSVLELPTVNVDCYDDGDELGLTTSDVILNEKEIAFSYTLKSGYEYPYAAIRIDDSSFFEVNDKPLLSFNLKVNAQQRLYVMYSCYNSAGKTIRYRAAIEVSPNKRNYELDLRYFNVPEWYRTFSGITDQDIAASNKNKTFSLSFSNGLNSVIGQGDSYTLGKLVLKPDNFNIVAIFVIGLFILNVYFIFPKNKFKRQVIIQSVQLEEEYRNSDDSEKQRLFDYLSKNYSDSEITRSFLSKSLTISESNITKYIQSEFGLSYKDYINQIRVNEAKRLLKSTNESIKFIAYSTGFSSLATFNRVFKSIVSKTPTEFRES